MSLLMEALKRAEEAKRQTGANRLPEATPELTLKPLDSPPSAPTTPATPATPSTSPGSPLPDLSLHIDSLDADLAAVSTEAPARRRGPSTGPKPPPAPPRVEADRGTARTVFSAKQEPPGRTNPWFFIGPAIALALALVAYFWWQLQSVPAGSLAQPAPNSNSSALRQPEPPAPTQPAPAQLAPTPTPDTPKPLPEQDVSSSRAPVARPTPFQKQSSPPAPPASTQAAARPAPETAGDGGVRLSRSTPAPNLTLERAYEALQAGRLDEARAGYERTLRNDAKNTDALLGLATIAARQGQAERAHAFYMQALESDPNDPTAQAGVINMRGLADPSQSESRLKTALSRQPDSPALNFALGNLYARQENWSEAQQAYFRAYSTEPDNADFIFNLAVSLDHMHQDKLAAQYYRMALDTAELTSASSAPSFDGNLVRRRLLELQP
jgi:tetratricopeptide (TPR) repeat protein